MRVAPEIDPPFDEVWSPAPPAPTPPAGVIDGPGGRLTARLRDLARRADPRECLTAASREAGSLATAMADLAVTGERAYARFAASPPTEADVGSAAVLDRAFEVVWALRGPDHARLRPALDWIAVSGEDDSPARPVNAASLPYPQFDIPVIWRDLTLRTRCAITLPVAPAQVVPRALPPTLVPEIPADHSVVLFLHGHSSCAEEMADLAPALLSAAGQRERPIAIVAFDLPSNGYSAMVDHTSVAPADATRFEISPLGRSLPTYPLLDFLDEFVMAFVDALDAVTPIKHRIAAVIGGSLGGNLGLRLAERDLPWLPAVVSWSPASVWNSFTHDLIKGVPLLTVRSRMNEEESDRSRHRFFHQSFDSGVGPGQKTQPELWYRDGWPGKAALIESGRHEREEIYCGAFRRWHWRVALEQLLFSHHSADTPSGVPRYALNTTPTLLAAGNQDNFPFARIYSATRRLAERMTATPGSTLFVRNTGHSIHNERPRLLATQIADFLWSTAD